MAGKGTPNRNLICSPPIIRIGGASVGVVHSCWSPAFFILRPWDIVHRPPIFAALSTPTSATRCRNGCASVRKPSFAPLRNASVCNKPSQWLRPRHGAEFCPLSTLPSAKRELAAGASFSLNSPALFSLTLPYLSFCLHVMRLVPVAAATFLGLDEKGWSKGGIGRK